MKEEVKLIPIDCIRVINPRHRDAKKFQAIVQSIKTLGLKKPIKVSLRSKQEGDEPGYDLVAGQGRIEACKVLGFKEIAAIVVEVSKEDRLLMSLIENMARRFPAPMDIVGEIQRLQTVGYTYPEISEKLGIDKTLISGLFALIRNGEERLVHAVMMERIPIRLAVEIAKSDSAEAQNSLLHAYENGQLENYSLRTLRNVIERRRILGKRRQRGQNPRTTTTADGMVNSYRREIQRQNALIKKARRCEATLLFIATAVQKLLQDDNFINLLKAEGLSTMPEYLADRAALVSAESWTRQRSVLSWRRFGCRWTRFCHCEKSLARRRRLGGTTPSWLRSEKCRG